jgi:transcriptional regulator with XRE-family HTH domain
LSAKLLSRAKWTQKRIGEELGLPKQTLSDILSGFKNEAYEIPTPAS